MEISFARKDISQVSLVVLLLCVLVGPNFGPVPQFLNSRMGLEASVIGLLVCFVISFIAIIAVIMWLENRRFGEIRQFLYALGLGKPTRWLAVAVGTLVGLAWGALFLSSISQFKPDANVAELSLFRVLAAGLAAFGAVLEDVVTRGFLMNRLQQLQAPGWVQAIVSALIFALYHTLWAFNIFGFIASVIYGLILAGLYLWGKRSLTPVILAHSLAVLVGEPFATMLIFLVPGA